MALLAKDQVLKLIQRRHPEWQEHQLRWRWLLDSLEGGERYRQAVYGADRRGMPIRNLIRHKREYPDPREVPGSSHQPGSSAVYLGGVASSMAGGRTGPTLGLDQAQYATDDDYELRRARTPVPTFLAEAVDTYTSTIYASEVDRDAPEGGQYDGLRAWWADVDGRGTPVDDWMEHTIAPLLLALGQLDLVFDHPPAPPGKLVQTDADAIALGVKRCVAGYILPENLLWWRLDSAGRYEECLVLEYVDGGGEVAGEGFGPFAAQLSAPKYYRHWTAEGWTLYAEDGTGVAYGKHRFGRVPIVRVFDRRKPRCKNVGKPRLESVAERQREYYNRDSELILSDTIQAHPVLQGPDDYVQEDQTIPVGPGNLLPMKGNGSQADKTYQGFEYVDPPKGAADSLRQNKADIRNDVDRDAKLTKPAGTSGTNGTTVAQSGVSKEFDHDGLHKALSQIAKMLCRVELAAVQMALVVLFDGKPPTTAADDVTITYPTVFNLYSAEDLIRIGTDLQGFLSGAGDAPETETLIACAAARKALPGRDDATYDRLDQEIEATIAAKAKRAADLAEMGPQPPALAAPGQGTDAAEGGDDDVSGSNSEPGEPSTLDDSR